MKFLCRILGHKYIKFNECSRCKFSPYLSTGIFIPPFNAKTVIIKCVGGGAGGNSGGVEIKYDIENGITKND